MQKKSSSFWLTKSNNVSTRPNLQVWAVHFRKIVEKKPRHAGFFSTAKNYFLGASAGAAAAGAAAASAGFASAAGAAGAAGVSAAGAAAAGAGAGAASSFLPQAAKAAAAITAAKMRDLFMIIFLKVSEKTISGKLSSRLE
jgi:hypothetical protein